MRAPAGRASFGSRMVCSKCRAVVRRHTGETFPRRSCRKFDADSFLHRLCAVHRNPGGRAIATKIVSLVEDHHVVPLHRRLLGRQPRQGRRERLGDVDRRVARRAARPLLSVGTAEDDDGHGSECHSGSKISVVRRVHRLLPCKQNNECNSKPALNQTLQKAPKCGGRPDLLPALPQLCQPHQSVEPFNMIEREAR